MIEELRVENTPLSTSIADHIESFTDYDFAHLLFSDGYVEQSISLATLSIYQKSRLSAIDKYVHQCGFINHIDRITEACKQRNKSVYMLFWLFRTFLQSLFISNATNPPFTLGLRVKGDKRARLTSFPRQKGGEKHETIFFSDHNRKSV